MTTPLQIGRYRILEEIASGSQGAVYRGFDPQEGRIVALKVLHSSLTADPAYLERFHREAQMAVAIDHPNVVKVFEVGESGGRHFIAMEFLPETLARVLDSGGALPVGRAVQFAAQIADGLAAAHALGIVHRDVKPQNVLIGPNGEAKVTDFGIARAAALSNMTATGMIMGTPYYMSPEQANGQATDARSDLYSLGCVLYQMLTGELPFQGTTPLTVLRRHVEETPRSVRSICSDVPTGVAGAVEKAMAKDPAQRFQNMGELTAALRGMVAGLPQPITQTGSTVPAPGRALPGSLPTLANQPLSLGSLRGGRWIEGGWRNKYLLGGALVSLVSVVVAVGFLTLVLPFQPPNSPPPPEAERKATPEAPDTDVPGPTVRAEEGVASGKDINGPILPPAAPDPTTIAPKAPTPEVTGDISTLKGTQEIDLMSKISLANTGMVLEGKVMPLGNGATFRRAEASASGFVAPSIFAHPPYMGVSGEVFGEFTIPLPDSPAITLEFDIGLSDGSEKSDGVTFIVHVQGREIFHRHYTQQEWQHVSLDLTRYRGQQVILRLSTNPGPNGNTDWDWAHWGQPKFLVASTATNASVLTAGFIEGKVLFEDDFESGLAENWHSIGDGFYVVQDQGGNYVLRGIGLEQRHPYARVGDTQWENYAVEFNVKFLEQADGNDWEAEVNVRRDNNSCKYTLWFQVLQESGVGLQRRGPYTDCERMSLKKLSMRLERDQWYSVRIEAVGPTITTYLDGKQILYVMDDKPVIYGPIRLMSGPGAIVDYDDVRVVELVPSEPTPTPVRTSESTEGKVLFVANFDRGFAIGSSELAEVAQGADAARILAARLGDDFATIDQGASIHDVSSGLYGIEPCKGETSRLPCSDPRDVIDRVKRFSIYGTGGETGNFIFGTTEPQFLILDLGKVVELDRFGADFSEHEGDRGVDSFGVLVSLDGMEYTSLSAPVDNPVPPVVFSIDTPVRARFIAYYFGRCAGSNCPGSRVFKVYAQGAAK